MMALIRSFEPSCLDWHEPNANIVCVELGGSMGLWWPGAPRAGEPHATATPASEHACALPTSDAQNVTFGGRRSQTMPNTGSSTLTTGAVATTSPAQEGVHDCGTCASAGPCWQTALPVYDSAEERTLNASNSSPHLRHIQPTRVKRSRKVCVTALKLPPFQQTPSPSLEAQQQFKGQPHTPLPRLTHSFHTSSLGDSQQHHQQHSTAARMATSPRTVASTAAYLPSAGPLLLGVRLCIGTGHGPRTGKVVDVQNSGKHRILFDEGKCEWINLSSSQWTWQTPRAASAGLTPALSQALRKLGAANLVAEPQPPCAGPEGSVLGPAPATAEAAVGQQLWLWCAASGRWHAGLVVALSQAGTGAHHIVYADGADEWVMLSHEVVVWVAAPTEGQAPLRHICPSLAAGTPTPNGEAAVNWRLGIYWHDDQTFFEGTITKYIASSGKHELAYDDGEEEQVELDGQDVVVWRCRLRDTPRARKGGSSGSHGGALEDGAAGQDKNKRQHTSRSGRVTSR